jgi:release factor glutamine methyltransferase
MLAWMAKDLAALSLASPRLEAELLLSHALGCDRVRLYMDMQRPLDRQELAAVRALVVRRRRREPVAYILGRREFYKRDFEVDASVLVPRPETEVLVDRALDALPEGPLRALDLCTGSGVVAITLALEREGLIVDATDISEPALAVARRNAARHAIEERVQFHHGDLFEALPEPRRYALIAANPPYVRDDEWPQLAPDVAEHEPRIALLAGPSGLSVIERLCATAADWLEPGGALLMEVGRGQAGAVGELLARTGSFERITAHRDLAGIERVVAARKKR